MECYDHTDRLMLEKGCQRSSMSNIVSIYIFNRDCFKTVAFDNSPVVLVRGAMLPDFDEKRMSAKRKISP